MDNVFKRSFATAKKVIVSTDTLKQNFYYGVFEVIEDEVIKDGSIRGVKGFSII